MIGKKDKTNFVNFCVKAKYFFEDEGWFGPLNFQNATACLVNLTGREDVQAAWIEEIRPTVKEVHLKDLMVKFREDNQKKRRTKGGTDEASAGSSEGPPAPSVYSEDASDSAREADADEPTDE